MLKIDGNKVIDVTQETPGPKIGHILNALLEEVLENPKLNDEVFLVKRSIELSKLSYTELKALGDKGRERKDTVEDKNIQEIRGKTMWSSAGMVLPLENSDKGQRKTA
jgi:hypothetical protein